ncbi:hypothetical protein ABC255_09465 [Neobacillus sp. 3P2-tot-E-2]|uniref:hypothetical protein n=1 Tax=Neobacillus sp. 3P2-tot-E-2 TaxID=3132212 RepID=UPI00399FA905
MGNIENPMVLDSHWPHLEQPEPKVIGECVGCQEDIVNLDAWLELMVDGEEIMIHQDVDCTYQFIADRAVCKGE